VDGMFRIHLLQRRDEHRLADKSRSGDNILLDWAKIVDCGDAPLTFLVCFYVDCTFGQTDAWLGQHSRSETA
jgi:hypothetical protein